jgi:hypothetical protein
MKNDFAPNLQPGDLILIAASHYFRLGIYTNMGSTGNPHYYRLDDWVLQELKAGKTPKKKYLVYSTYIKKYNLPRIAKIDMTNIPSESKDLYREIRYLLGNCGLLKEVEPEKAIPIENESVNYSIL